MSIAWVLTCLWAQGADARELLRDLDEAHARRLEQYNSAFVREATYFASRYRIVEPDVEALLEQAGLAVTPFPDVGPIRLSPSSVSRKWSRTVYWRGGYENDPLLHVENGLFASSVSIFAHGYDVDESGAAAQASGAESDFFAVQTSLDDFATGNRYVLLPLKYTPRYAIVYEIAHDTVIPVRTDVMPGDPEPTPEEREASRKYAAFLESLPKETEKPILGDVY